MRHTFDYGFWNIVFINSLIFIIFAFSFARPRSLRDWRTFGTFSAFIVALFTEMYGFPLTIYLLSGWLSKHYPGINLYGHDAGHIWYTLLGLHGDPHQNPVHELSNWLILGGLLFLAFTWVFLYWAQRKRKVATTGPYYFIRHPQYVAFIAIMTGFLLQWPTILTLLMYPVLVTMYVRLARIEEREAIEQFGEAYVRYAAVTPGFFPLLWRRKNAG
ncbi:phospholipid methyltransferase [Lucifera butyrica]|uniref:Phospholipid methyltransferase n=1 Tax=Lucifera butyrica TaxID=1351585 RepID=A0A498RFP3_9FIRM|nr:isoprenylcysteine carboxylmethyltransferase family protein [Lucifera butyrica]VBB08902.1 phospholipid methyltransferase [Lucifera butyrica]